MTPEAGYASGALRIRVWRMARLYSWRGPLSSEKQQRPEEALR
jgi:hypothetical protein